jgi:hypothetical protein
MGTLRYSEQLTPGIQSCMKHTRFHLNYALQRAICTDILRQNSKICSKIIQNSEIQNPIFVTCTKKNKYQTPKIRKRITSHFDRVCQRWAHFMCNFQFNCSEILQKFLNGKCISSMKKNLAAQEKKLDTELFESHKYYLHR